MDPVSSGCYDVAGKGQLDKGYVTEKGRWVLFSSDVPLFGDSAT